MIHIYLHINKFICKYIFIWVCQSTGLWVCCVCLCVCMISSQSTSKKPHYNSDLSKLHALLYKTHIKNSTDGGCRQQGSG